ncbi:hypothetical protein APR12_001159 [Nocardia amikacinitolerans]|nr:hypothetical protein [Nocardia amikacinitolerans]
MGRQRRATNCEPRAARAASGGLQVAGYGQGLWAVGCGLWAVEMIGGELDSRRREVEHAPGNRLGADFSKSDR